MRNHFIERYFRQRQPTQQPSFSEVKQSLLQIAGKISERALQFANHIFTDKYENVKSLFKWQYKIDNPSKSPICSKIMNQNQNYISFRCYDCMQTTSACICAECFAKGDHKGHNFIQYMAINGCCDCGNDQSWNQKGFCSEHTKKINEYCQISLDVKNRFIEQFTFALYIYFYLVQQDKASRIKSTYGQQLFSHLIWQVSQNYEMKYLGYLLFTSRFPESYPKLHFNPALTIIQIIFSLKAETQALDRFVHLTFEMFPVQSFRSVVIKQYFKKERSLNPLFTRHPLGSLNFQFLTCVKQIVKMINNKEILPLQLAPIESSTLTGTSVTQSFKKLYEDFDYINNMKSSSQYHKIHLERGNICELVSYRTKTVTDLFSEDQKDIFSQFNLDEMFLKTFAYFIRSIAQQRQLMEKCLKELFLFMIKAKKNSVSLAHERVFAMLTLVYLKGNIQKLGQENTCKQFLNVISDNKQTLQIDLEYLIETSLSSKIQIQINAFQYQPNDFQRYFLEKHPQLNFCYFADTLFHKIMLLMSQMYQGYSKIVSKLLLNFKQNMSQFQILKQQQIHQMLAYSKITILLNFLNTVVRVNLDQIVIGVFMKIIKQPEITVFYERLLASFKNLNIKQFKLLAVSIINCEETIEKFIKKNALIEKGKLIGKQKVEPLETYFYHKIFTQYPYSLFDTDIHFFKGNEKLKYMQKIHIIDNSSVSLLIELSMNYLYKMSTLQLQASLQQQCRVHISHLLMQFLKISIQQNEFTQKVFFQSLLKQCYRPLITKDLIQQITLIQKSEHFDKETDRIKSEKQISNKIKKQKLLQKRKQKEILMKQNQQKMLNFYEKNVNELIHVSQETKVCIYCKESRNEELKYIAYMGFTNLIEKGIQKNEKYHLYFQSCGHLIHQKCFSDAESKAVKLNFCYLCKRQSNILIPQFSTLKQSRQEKQKRSFQFLEMILVLLVCKMQDLKQISPSAQLVFKQSKNSIYQIIIDSLCKDLLYIGLQEYSQYKKKLFPIYYELFLILKESSRSELQKVFLKLNLEKAMTQSEILLKYILIKLQRYLLENNELNELSLQIMAMLTPVQLEQINNIFYVFTENDLKVDVLNLTTFDRDAIFIDLPEKLNELNYLMGECKICGYITNYIYICIKCGYSCCQKCLKLMYQHGTFDHLDGTIFISCTNGGVKFIHENQIFEDESIYQNYLGESFMYAASHEMTKLEKYTLNKSKLNQLRSISLQYGIHQKIFTRPQ